MHAYIDTHRQWLHATPHLSKKMEKHNPKDLSKKKLNAYPYSKAKRVKRKSNLKHEAPNFPEQSYDKSQRSKK